MVLCNTWDTIANCKLQSGFSGEKCLEGELAAAWFWVDEVWDWGKGRDINQNDTSGGGKMIRIMVNKAA